MDCHTCCLPSHNRRQSWNLLFWTKLLLIFCVLSTEGVFMDYTFNVAVVYSPSYNRSEIVATQLLIEKASALRKEAKGGFLTFSSVPFSPSNFGIKNALIITKDYVCEQILNKSVAVILMHDRGEAQFVSAISYALGFYQVPVLSLHSRDTRFSDKSVYSSFVRVVPPWNREAEAWVQLLVKLKYKKAILIHTNDPDGESVYASFRNATDKHGVEIETVFSLDPDDEGQIKAVFKSKEIYELTSNIFLLFAKKKPAESVFDYANETIKSGKVWIVSEAALKAHNLPQGVLAMPLSSNLNMISDAIDTLEDGLTMMWDDEADRESSNISRFAPYSGCPNPDTTDTLSDWTQSTGPKLFSALIEWTNRESSNQKSFLRYDSNGDRIDAQLSIINYNGNGNTSLIGSVIKVGNTMELELDEKAILWPGNRKMKPKEMSLPTHLKAVSVEEPPFIFKLKPRQEGKDSCKNFYTREVNSRRDWPAVAPEVLADPDSWVPCDTDNGVEYCCTGLCVELLLMLSRANNSEGSNFTFDLRIMKQYGDDFKADGEVKYTGVVGALQREEADLGATALSITQDRQRHIDFSKPWLYYGIKIMEKRQPKMSQMESFMQPFTWALWASLFGTVILVGFALYALDKCSPFNIFYAKEDRPDNPLIDAGSIEADEPLSLSGSMWFVWGVLLDSGIGEKVPKSFSARVLGVVWCGFSMIMVTSYTANLAAFLVLDQPEQALTGIDDPRLRNPSDNFTFATVSNSSTWHYFKNHVEHATMFRQMEENNYESPDDAVNDVLQGRLNAFIWDSTRLEFEANRDCELVTVGSPFGTGAYGIGLQKNSPWTNIITAELLKLSEEGKMEILDTNWIMGDQSHSKCQVADKAPARLGLNNMKDVFILVGGGILLGFLLILVEIKYKRHQLRQMKRRQLAMHYGRLWLVKTRANKTFKSLSQSRRDGQKLNNNISASTRLSPRLKPLVNPTEGEITENDLLSTDSSGLGIDDPSGKILTTNPYSYYGNSPDRKAKQRRSRAKIHHNKSTLPEIERDPPSVPGRYHHPNLSQPTILTHQPRSTTGDRAMRNRPPPIATAEVLSPPTPAAEIQTPSKEEFGFKDFSEERPRTKAVQWISAKNKDSAKPSRGRLKPEVQV